MDCTRCNAGSIFSAFSDSVGRPQQCEKDLARDPFVVCFSPGPVDATKRAIVSCVVA